MVLYSLFMVLYGLFIALHGHFMVFYGKILISLDFLAVIDPNNFGLAIKNTHQKYLKGNKIRIEFID